jgi:hypothetical protein
LLMGFWFRLLLSSMTRLVLPLRLRLNRAALRGRSGSQTRRQLSDRWVLVNREAFLDTCATGASGKEVRHTTSWWVTKRPSQSRIVSEDLPHPESPMHTSFAM